MGVVEGRARKRGRLSRSGEFERVYRQGASHSNRFLVLYAFPRADEGEGEAGSESRLGVSVGRKIGGAVERNRVKRALREAYREISAAGELPDGHDFVLVARPGIESLVDEGGTTRVTECLREIVVEAGLNRRERKT